MKIQAKILKRPNLNAKIGGWLNTRRVTREFLAEMGFEVERRAKQKAPVDHGRLRGSLSTAWAGHPGQPSSFRDYAADPADAVSTPSRSGVVRVGSQVEYALPVHERHPTKAQFLRRSLDEVRSGVARFAKRFDSRQR